MRVIIVEHQCLNRPQFAVVIMQRQYAADSYVDNLSVCGDDRTIT